MSVTTSGLRRLTGHTSARRQRTVALAAALLIGCCLAATAAAESRIEGIRALVLTIGAAPAIERIRLNWDRPVTVRFEHSPRAATLIVGTSPAGAPAGVPSKLQLGGTTAKTAKTPKGFEIVLDFKQPMIPHLLRSGTSATLRFEPTSAPAKKPTAPLVRLESTETGPQLVIVTREPRPAAVFRYGGHHWIVVATPHALRVSGTTPGLVARFGAIELTQFKDAAAIRIGGVRDYLASVHQDGAVWRVAFRGVRGATDDAPPAPGAETKLIAPKLTQNRVSAVDVEIPDVPGAAPVRIVDPVVGATLYVVPVTSSNTVVPQGFRYMPFRLLPTLVGLAIEPLADGVTVARRNAGVVVRYRRADALRSDQEPDRQDARQ